MTVDRNQADAIARAILEPDLKAQEQLRQRREKEAAALTVQRRAAGFALVGMAIGGTIGHYAFGEVSRYLIVGGVVAYLIARLAHRRTA